LLVIDEGQAGEIVQEHIADRAFRDDDAEFLQFRGGRREPAIHVLREIGDELRVVPVDGDGKIERQGGGLRPGPGLLDHRLAKRNPTRRREAGECDQCGDGELPWAVNRHRPHL